MPGDYFFLNYGLQDGNVMQGLFRVNKTTYELEVYDGATWNLVQVGGQSAVANPMTTVQRTAIVPAAGVLIWDTDYDRLYVGNGSTRGGLTLSAQSQVMTTVQRTAIVPAAGVLIWDTDLGALFVGDGTTAGGVSVASGESGIVAGNRLNFDENILNFNPDAQIITVVGNTVTLEPDKAYKAYATNSGLTIKANPPAAGYWGYEGHLELFVASLGYVQVDTTTVTLFQPLEPDSVNNCTVRFHDGRAIISIEDHIAGYIVTVSSGTTAGSLYYGLSTASEEYISVDASLNGTTLDLGGVVTSAGEKHIVGNGYSETAISGTIDCATNKVTVTNLSLQDVGITGGTMTLTDVHIPNGSTVSVSGGRLAVKKVTGDGTIDLNGPRPEGVSNASTVSLGSVTLTNGMGAQFGGGLAIGTYSGGAVISGGIFLNCSATSAGGGVANIGSGNTVDGCVFSGCSAPLGGGFDTRNKNVIVKNCTFIDNTASNNITNAACFNDNGVEGCYFVVDSCDFKEEQNIGCYFTYSGSVLELRGTNKTIAKIGKAYDFVVGKINVASGAVIDLTGNTNSTPIAHGGGIVVGENVQIYPSAGSASAVTIGGGTYTAITNGGVLNGPYTQLGSGSVISGNATINMNNTHYSLDWTSNKLIGVTISGGSASDYGGAVRINNAAPVISGVTFTGNQVGFRGTAISMHNLSNKSPLIQDCIFSGNISAKTKGALCIVGANAAPVISNCQFVDEDIIGYNCGGSITLAGNNTINNIRVESGTLTTVISSGVSINLTSSIAPGGGIVVDGGCTVNGVEVAGGTYTSIVSSGGSAVINQ